VGAVSRVVTVLHVLPVFDALVQGKDHFPHLTDKEDEEAQKAAPSSQLREGRSSSDTSWR
jgi:hypothetical protein